ncbi:hypothetical protein GCM10011410_31510 [Hoyosella rhizosphaerae]|uniref:Rv3660c-like CheY-like N-terminal domain-containing protein n=1 Tax=Hoyosella rhizosphaerae TaxID=1755582 RepID=A0A916UKT4_9ACTN|nr:hypothetical protein GCM10011410_31510 [Hoyosella rhizosphaerae]
MWIRDAALLTQLRRIAAASRTRITEHCEETHTDARNDSELGMTTSHHSASIQELWRRAHTVVLDKFTAADCHKLAMPRRDNVIVVFSSARENAGRSTADVGQWRGFVELGIKGTFNLPEDERELMVALAQTNMQSARRHGAVIAVTSACGGAGATILSCALALAVPDRTLLVDLDQYGGGADVVLGAENISGLRWPEIGNLTSGVATEALWAALPTVGTVSLLAHEHRAGTSPRRHPGVDNLRALLDATRTAGHHVICDVPRTFDDTNAAVFEAADLTVLVIPTHLRACVAAQRTLAWLAPRSQQVGLVIRGPSPSGITAMDISRACGDVPTIATMRSERILDSRIDHAPFRLQRRSPLRDAATKILTACSAPRII